MLLLVEYSMCDMKMYLVNITGYSLVNSEIHHLQFVFEDRANEERTFFLMKRSKGIINIL